ncbi:MAG: hypothetical protein ICV81_11485 [Flavisolibacter sp.]|nr:hypothetical protein [Flavisolibacter sp.]
MHNSKVYKRLLFQNEVLRSKLKIREYFLDSIVRDVYENIGQVLSLVRMQLAALTFPVDETSYEKITTSSHLVAQAIGELRNMCRHFYPDAGMIKDLGWIEEFKSIVDTISPEADVKIPEEEPIEIDLDASLILFRILQEMLFSIKDREGEIIDLCITYRENTIEITTNYRGEFIKWEQINGDSDWTRQLARTSIYERVSLIEGSLFMDTLKTGMYCIVLKIPIKSALHE